MTDLTTRPAQAGTSVPVPVNGAVVGDVRALRYASRAEQERLSADAEVERRARAARLDLELREQRQATARREHQADVEDKRTRTEQRRARRAARRAGFRAAAPRWAERALFVLPILFPMAVAWVGQIRFAMAVMGWPLPAAVVFAAGFELSTAYVARLDWRSRAAGDSALLFRAATWGFAGGAAVMNYWHAAGAGFAPNGEAVSYGLMSITGVVLWELLSTYRHRTALRVEGKLPAVRPRFGLARWVWFARLTRLAWLLALRDGYATTELAWRAALGAVGAYGSARAARKAIRAGRPVPRTELPAAGERDDAGEPRDGRDAKRPEGERDTATQYPRRDTATRRPRRDSVTRGNRRDGKARAGTDREHRGAAPVPHEHPASRDGNVADDPAGSGRDPDQDPAGTSGLGAMATRMEAYARDRLADGVTVTGAELDRQFGTRDYGRKVLRRVTAGSGTR